MKKNIKSGSIYFLVGLGLGFVIFSPLFNPEENVPMSMDKMDSTTMATHAHSMLEVDKTVPVPTVEIESFKDEKDGYNLHVFTKNYVFTPEKVNSEPIQGEGHAHIYVNGIKAARLYGDWFNLPSSFLKDGDNVIEVTLNANDHSEWVVDGQHLSASTTITQ